MPIFRSGQAVPSWCEMTFFEMVRLQEGQTYSFPRLANKEKLFVCEGHGSVLVGDVRSDATRGQICDLNEDGFIVSRVYEPTTMVRVCGNWGNEIGSYAVFTLDKSAHPRNDGDPTPYTRNTVFDQHYHDFDEYWIITKGRGRVVTEGQVYDVAPGDCVATGMGHHHYFPLVFE